MSEVRAAGKRRNIIGNILYAASDFLPLKVAASVLPTPRTPPPDSKRFRTPWPLLALAVMAQAPALAAPGAADAPQASAATPQAPGVTVQGRRESLEREVRTFVRQLTHSSRFSSESVPRWRDALCFLVAGLPGSQGSFVAARLTQVAAAAGAKVRTKGCVRRDVNFYVVFTPDPARTLKYLDVHPALLFQSDASREQMAQFLNPGQPEVVRVWHNAVLTGADGQSLAAGVSSCAALPGMVVNCTHAGSRLSLQAIQQFTEALVVVDLNRLDGATLGQVSDYVALAGLADFALHDNFGDAPTILRLFRQPPATRPSELTQWDRAFLNALYHTDQRSVTQREHIADDILHGLTD